MDRLIEHAADLGLRVKFQDLGRRAGQLHSSGLVFINPARSVLTQRITLAHECGHWAHGHDWTHGHDVVHDERQADTYAARLLIDPVEYAAAEEICGGHLGAIAKELGLTTRLLELWRADYLRHVGVIRLGFVPTQASRARGA